MSERRRTVRRPKLTVPTNLQTEIVGAAIVSVFSVCGVVSIRSIAQCGVAAVAFKLGDVIFKLIDCGG